MAKRPKTYQDALREGEKKRGSNFSLKNIVSDFQMAIGAKPKSGLYKLQTRRGIDRLRNPEPTAAEKVRAMSRSIGRSDDRIEREKAEAAAQRQAQAAIDAQIKAGIDAALAERAASEASATQTAQIASTTPQAGGGRSDAASAAVDAANIENTAKGAAEARVADTVRATGKRQTIGTSAQGLLTAADTRKRRSLLGGGMLT